MSTSSRWKAPEIKMLFQSDTKVFDITELVSGIQYTTDLKGQPGKLTFNLEQDPKGEITMTNGSLIKLYVNGKGIFFGYVFTMGTDATGIYKITAYDQMRYLKNEDSMYIEGITASQMFSLICTQHELRHRVVTPTTFIVPEYNFEGKQLYAMLEHGIQHTNVSYDQRNRHHFIRDDFGTLLFTDLTQYMTNLAIGDESLLTSYQYEISIDKDTYNTIKVTRDNESTGKRDVWMTVDSNNIKRWGRLQKVTKADKSWNEAMIQKLAFDLIRLHDSESQTMKLNALGVMDIVAGTMFTLQLKKLNINQMMWVTSATHTFDSDFHTMALDVYIAEDIKSLAEVMEGWVG